MKRRLACALGSALVLLALTGTPAATARTVPIGIGEQQLGVFSDPRWIRLGMVHARYLTPWDTLAHRHARGELDAWMAAARSARARVTLSFRHGHRARRDAREFPTPARFKAAFLGSRRRYPDVRSYIVWNEANHPLSYSAHHPRRVAKLFDVAARNCHGCRIVGADALDVTGMLAWVRAFLRGAHERPRIWGLHNYVGVRERQSFSTRVLLAAVRGRIWFTETGGWLVRQKLKRGRVMQAFHTSAHQAARATRFALRLACVGRRIGRIYLYTGRRPGGSRRGTPGSSARGGIRDRRTESCAASSGAAAVRARAAAMARCADRRRQRHRRRAGQDA